MRGLEGTYAQHKITDTHAYSDRRKNVCMYAHILLVFLMLYWIPLVLLLWYFVLGKKKSPNYQYQSDFRLHSSLSHKTKKVGISGAPVHLLHVGLCSAQKENCGRKHTCCFQLNIYDIISWWHYRRRKKRVKHGKKLVILFQKGLTSLKRSMSADIPSWLLEGSLPIPSATPRSIVTCRRYSKGATYEWLIMAVCGFHEKYIKNSHLIVHQSIMKIIVTFIFIRRHVSKY